MPSGYQTPIAERLLNQLDRSKGPNSCWGWTGSISRMRDDRAVIVVMGVSFHAHRVAYMLFKGPIPKGLKVCHSCDNTICCNPNHLFLGTQLDNVRDMIAKGRSPDVRGENHPGAKLTEDEVREIRRRYPKEGRSLAKEFGIAYSMPYKIYKRELWKHVK